MPHTTTQRLWQLLMYRLLYEKVIEIYKKIFLSSHLQKALASTSWMDGSGSGSSHTTRFELPMDLKTLEGIALMILTTATSEPYHAFCIAFQCFMI